MTKSHGDKVSGGKVTHMRDISEKRGKSKCAKQFYAKNCGNKKTPENICHMAGNFLFLDIFLLSWANKDVKAKMTRTTWKTRCVNNALKFELTVQKAYFHSFFGVTNTFFR